VPALVTDRGTLTETPAILAYIAQSFPQARLMPDDPFAFAQAQSFNSYLCSTVHINHAHKMRGYRWAVEESSFADMKRKVPETMAASFALIERDMIKGPWVMGEQYTVCDPYLYTIALWLEGDGVDLTALPKVAAHRQRMSERPAVQKVLAEAKA
jgi:glutathione S-transferase